MNDNILAKDYCVTIFDGTHETPKPVENGYPLATSKNILGNKLDLSSTYNISKKDFDSISIRSKISQWDILFSMIGSVGNVYIETNPEVSYAIKNMGVFSCRDELKAKWFYYYLQTPSAKQHILRYLNGAVQKFLPLGGLRNFPVLQFSSHSVLVVSLLSSIDSKIELNSKINTELEAMARTIYDFWFVQFDFPCPREIAIAQGQPELEGKPYKSSGGKMVWNVELKRNIPSGWEVKPLSQVGDIYGGSTPSTSIQTNFTDNGIPWITPKDMSQAAGNKFISKGEQDISEQGMKQANLRLLPKGTVLLTSRAPVGYTAIARNDLTTNQGFKSLIPSKGYPSSFLLYTILTIMPSILHSASGSTFKEISGGTLESIRFYFPSEKLANQYSELVNSIFIKQEKVEQESQQLASLRDFLLPLLMNGQVTVA